MENTVVRIQDKGSRFVLPTNEDCKNQVEHQIVRSYQMTLVRNLNAKSNSGLVRGS